MTEGINCFSHVELMKHINSSELTVPSLISQSIPCDMETFHKPIRLR